MVNDIIGELMDSQDWERDSGGRKDAEDRSGKLVAGCVHPPCEERVSEEEYRQDGQALP